MLQGAPSASQHITLMLHRHVAGVLFTCAKRVHMLPGQGDRVSPLAHAHPTATAFPVLARRTLSTHYGRSALHKCRSAAARQRCAPSKEKRCLVCSESPGMIWK